MKEKMVPKVVMPGQIYMLPEDLQFDAVQCLMELMVNKKLLEDKIAELTRRLSGMCFVFKATPLIPLKEHKKLKDERPYVSQSGGEFLARVFRKTCCRSLLIMACLMAVKFLAVCFHTEVLEQLGTFVSDHFLLVTIVVFAGCMVLSTKDIARRDHLYKLKLDEMNKEIDAYNCNCDKQNVKIHQDNQQIEKKDEKRREDEEKVFDTTKNELLKLLNACEKSRENVLENIKLLQNLNVLPHMFFEDGNRMLPIVYDLMQNRVTTTMYGLKGALEKARSMLVEEEMMNHVKQIVENTAKTAEGVDRLNRNMQDVQYKLDSLSFQMGSLVESQNRMNFMLAEASQSNQEVVEAIERQSHNLASQNKALASDIDKSIRDNSLSKYVYDPTLLGTYIDIRKAKKNLEG